MHTKSYLDIPRKEKSHLDLAIQYVKENKTWKDYDEAKALDCINNRLPLPAEIKVKIAELMDEYGEANDLPEDWWCDQATEEDIFFMI